MEPPELDIEEVEAISGPAEPLTVPVPVGPGGPGREEDAPGGPRFGALAVVSPLA